MPLVLALLVGLESLGQQVIGSTFRIEEQAVEVTFDGGKSRNESYYSS